MANEIAGFNCNVELNRLAGVYLYRIAVAVAVAVYKHKLAEVQSYGLSDTVACRPS
jgi:hypothetical protein